MTITHESRQLKIKVFVLRGGGGHYATYRAIRDVLQQVRPAWQVEALFADSLGEASSHKSSGQQASDQLSSNLSQTLSASSDRFYDFILKNGFGWVHLITVHIHKLLTRLKHGLDVKLLRETWQQDPPALVLSVVPFQNRALWESLQPDFPQVPVVTVLTDFADSPPAYWMAPTTDNYVLCPTDKAVHQALNAGVRNDRVVRMPGLMVHPRFYDTGPGKSVAQRRTALGLDPDRTTALVMFGANGSKVMLDIARQLSTFGARIQTIFICGRNLAVAEALKAEQTVYEQTAQKRAVVSFTDDVPSYMQLADFLIGKPGNVSVSEAIAMNLPTIVERNWLTLTQERYAADWLVAHEVGLSVSSFKQIGPAVEKMIAPENLTRYRANVQQLENPAVFELAEKLEKIVEGAL